MAPARIVLTTFGSLGDLHPYLALGLGLQARGYQAVIATSPYYRAAVEALGLGFRAIRPDHPDPDGKKALMRQVMDQRTGPEFVIRDLVMPVLRDSYDDTLAAAVGADLLVSHPLTFTTRLVAEKLEKPWASTLLAPLSLFSVYDPPVYGVAPFLARLSWLGPGFNRFVFRFARRAIRDWSAPWHRLRADLELPAVAEEPLIEGQHAPRLVLALFSAALAPPQPDWPPHTVVTGFPFYEEATPLAAELQAFLDAGDPPLVFTLGSSAVHDAGAFYEESIRAAQKLGRRAVLLVGSDPRNRPASLPDGVAVFEYAPFAALFPRAAAIIHQGGIGTTAQAMRAGRPMLVMPYSHDQPDNAARVRRLGIARLIARRRYTADRVATELRPLLADPAYAERAQALGTQVRREDGVQTACDALEKLLKG